MSYYAVVDEHGKPRIICARLLPHIKVICRSAPCNTRAAAKKALRVEIGYNEKKSAKTHYKRIHIDWCNCNEE